MSTEQLVADGAVSVREAAWFTGFGRSKLFELMADGTLPYVMNGNKRLILKAGLKRLLADRLAACSPSMDAGVPR